MQDGDKATKRGRKIIEFDPSDKATSEWVGSLSKSSKNTSSGHWRRIMLWAGMSGDAILASRRADTNADWEKKVLQLKEWMKAQKDPKTGEFYSDLYARQSTVTLRSFFSFHRCKLEPTHQEAGRLNQARRKTEDYRFSRDELRRMASVADTEGKYIVVVGKSFGLRVGDFLRLTRGHFSTVDLSLEPPIFLCEYATEKEGVSAFPFLDSDAVGVVKDLLRKMDREGRAAPTEPMLKYKNDVELSRVLKRLAKEAGIEAGNKRVRFHCLRKFLIDHLSDVMSESKWKQVVGKKISEGAYVSPDNLREDYLRAMAETTFVKQEGNVELLAKKQALLMMLKLQGITEKEVEAMFTPKRRMMRRLLTLSEEVEALEEAAMKSGKGKAKGCADGEHCQRIATEEELPELLAQGWHVAAALPSGKVVVSNE
jgi:integrase